MIDPDVRAAAPDDVDQLVFLEQGARAALVDARGGQRWLSTHPIRSDQWAEVLHRQPVVVAHIGDIVVGYVVVSFDADVARVDEVYVTPEAREVGFGDELLAAAVQYARERGRPCSRAKRSLVIGTPRTSTSGPGSPHA